jgi:two-component system cell cycle sensor histidine kinase/response regulator CckA
MPKKLFQDKANTSFYVLLIMTIGMVLIGWYNVYSQYISLRSATTKSIQAAELEIVRATARAAKLYWADQLTILGLDANSVTPEQTREIELNFLKNYVQMKLLVAEGNAWVIGNDNRMVFDESDDFPYFGTPIDKFMPMQAAKQGGARDYEQMLNDVLNRREGIGWYVWVEDKGSEYAGIYTWEKGSEIGAWAPAIDKEKHLNWMIGLTTPLAAIMRESGAHNSVNQSFIFMAIVTVVIGLIFYGFTIEQRQVKVLQQEVQQLKIEIDETRKQKDIEQIFESDSFQTIKKRAAEIRARSNKS